MSDTITYACADPYEFAGHLERLAEEGWHVEDVTPAPTIGVIYEISLQHMRLYGYIDEYDTEWDFRGAPEEMYAARLISGAMP